jgi:predicted transcriptional regulator
MSLEEERVKNEDPSLRQLFFGEIEKAVSLAVSLPKTYKSGKNLVVYSTSSVKGENVRSISSEIHAKIIEQLQKEAKTPGDMVGND